MGTGSASGWLAAWFCGLCVGAMSGANAQGMAPDPSLCSSNCESEKKLCRSADSSPAVFAAASLLALVLDQPKAFATPTTLDNKRDMRDVLEARQRASDEVKNARREIDEQCNSAYLQCKGACLSAPPSITKP